MEINERIDMIQNKTNNKVLFPAVPLNEAAITERAENHANNSQGTIRIEDYFDINALTEDDIRSISNDIRAFLPKEYGSVLSEEGDILIKESSYLTASESQLRKELKKIGFVQWQIKSEILHNKVKVIILYVDIAKNTSIIENKMFVLGWSKARISEPKLVHGMPIRVMEFDPIEQESLTEEARRYKYLYHLTPYKNADLILKNGIEARSENDYFSYPPKAHLIKGDIPKKSLSEFGWMLYNKKSKQKDGRYVLLRIVMSKVPNSVQFYGDPRFEYGYFTKETIPPYAVELFGEVEYKDKYNYRGETIRIKNESNDILI